eukprot:TRINITY_DN108401_c0_g1_i1.p1 TRINITY_DN108401_c0_g1~~TRINITY_DN108401_c0_g1_i1.p1  ORF type:complete len:423 (+),score=65.16 TRINITY_DN108401_c0_g1_i1:35-1303(+)
MLAAPVRQLFSACVCNDDQVNSEATVAVHSLDEAKDEVTLDRAEAGDEKLRKASFDADSASTAAPSSRGATPRDVTGLDVLAKVTNSMIMDSISEVVAEVKDRSDAGFHLQKILKKASANFGEVALGETNTGTKIAVKVMPNSWMTRCPQEFSRRYPTAIERPWHDVGITKLLNERDYTYSLRFMGICTDAVHTFVTLELATEGNLITWCGNNVHMPPGPQREKEIIPMAVEVFSAVQTLHELGIAHRDISCENILLTTEKDGQRRIKLIDFGVACAEQFCTKWGGKPSYRAPELLLRREYDAFLADTFAVGVVLFLITFNDYPWKSTEEGSCKMFEFVRRHGLMTMLTCRRERGRRRRFLTDTASPELIETMHDLMRLCPDDRHCLGELCYLGRRPSIWVKSWICQADMLNSNDGEFRFVV